MEEQDCVYYTQESTVKYCVRLGEVISLSIESKNCFYGEKWNFSDLLIKEISPWEVLSWSSSIEKADNYARVFYNRSEEWDQEQFVCNCTQSGSFGKNCQYQLALDFSSFSENLKMMFRNKKDPASHQQWGNILCYTTLIVRYVSIEEIFVRGFKFVWMESMKKIVTNWSSMNAKTMSIGVLMGCVFQENIGSMVS